MTDVVLRDNLERLAAAMGDEVTKLRVLLNADKATLSDLTTTNKTNIVAAINELKAALGPGVLAVLDDGSPKTNKTWSSSHIIQQITQSMNAALTAIRGGAPTGLDTLGKIAQSLGNRTDILAFVSDELGKRVRTDTDAQGLTTVQKSNARKNIDAVGVLDIGAEVDLVALFKQGLRTDLL